MSQSFLYSLVCVCGDGGSEGGVALFCVRLGSKRLILTTILTITFCGFQACSHIIKCNMCTNSYFSRFSFDAQKRICLCIVWDASHCIWVLISWIFFSPICKSMFRTEIPAQHRSTFHRHPSFWWKMNKLLVCWELVLTKLHSCHSCAPSCLWVEQLDGSFICEM